MSTPELPFHLSNSSEDADPEAQLLMSVGSRRATGQASLGPDGFSMEWRHELANGLVAAPPGLLVPYSFLASAVLRRGILNSRLRITARRSIFGGLNRRNPEEVTLVIPRRYRHEAREFVSALQIRIAEAQLPADSGPEG